MERKIKYVELEKELEEKIMQSAKEDNMHYNEVINVVIKDGFYRREQQRWAAEVVEEVLGLSDGGNENG